MAYNGDENHATMEVRVPADKMRPNAPSSHAAPY